MSSHTLLAPLKNPEERDWRIADRPDKNRIAVTDHRASVSPFSRFSLLPVVIGFWKLHVFHHGTFRTAHVNGA